VAPTTNLITAAWVPDRYAATTTIWSGRETGVRMDLIPYHIGIATNDLDASTRALTAALGLSWTNPNAGDTLMHDVEGRAQMQPVSRSSREGPVHVDLIKGWPGTLWEATAPVIHHVAYRTDDLPGDILQLEAAGWRLEITMADPDGRPSVFGYVVREDGMRLELVESAIYEAYINDVGDA
jgi:Glyoxalase/Bleomycin resistance protein/Dioxygenase superfamily